MTVQRKLTVPLAWQYLSKLTPDAYPGLRVVSQNNDGTHQLELNEAFWRKGGADIYVSEVHDFMRHFQDFLGHQQQSSEFAIATCKDAHTRKLMLDFVSAIKLYRKIPQALGQHEAVMKHAKQTFDRVRAQLQGNGLDLLLDSQAYRVLKRINQFSRPTELFASCCWLFTEQRHIHARLTAVGEDTHKRAAASVLKTTLDQLSRFREELSARHLDMLSKLQDYFTEHPCKHCFGSNERATVQCLTQNCTGQLPRDICFMGCTSSIAERVHSAGKLNVADDQGLDLQYPIWKPQMEVVQPASYAERMDGLICTAMRAAVEEYALSICKIAQDAGMSMRDVYEIANRQRTVLEIQGSLRPQITAKIEALILEELRLPILRFASAIMQFGQECAMPFNRIQQVAEVQLEKLLDEPSQSSGSSWSGTSSSTDAMHAATYRRQDEREGTATYPAEWHAMLNGLTSMGPFSAAETQLWQSGYGMHAKPLYMPDLSYEDIPLPGCSLSPLTAFTLHDSA